MARHRVEQVVEEADAGRALARARAVEVQRQLDVGLARGAMDLRGAAHARRSIDSACTGKPSARASAAPAGARRAAPRAARIRAPCAAGTWPATAPTGTERRRRWAARGWSRRRSRRTRWPAPRPTNRQPAFRTRSASASASSPTSSRCSGAISSASAARPATSLVSTSCASRARRPARRSTAASPRRAARLRARCTRPDCPAPCSAWAIRSSATSSGSAPAPRDHHELARPRDAVDAHLARRPAASPPARTGCRDPTITSTGRTDSVP